MKKYRQQMRDKQRKEKGVRNTSPDLEEEDVISQSKIEWSDSKVVNDVEYFHVHAESFIWRARDGTDRLIAGPEEIDSEHWFYFSELNDYFPLRTRYDGSEYIDIDGAGLLEAFLSCDRNAVNELKKMEFKMKTVVEDATGKPMTFEVLRMEYNKNPRYPQEFTYESCYPQQTYDWKAYDDRSSIEPWNGYGILNADQARELAEKEWEYTQMQRDFPSDDDEDIDARLALKCPHYSSYNGEYGGYGCIPGY